MPDTVVIPIPMLLLTLLACKQPGPDDSGSPQSTDDSGHSDTNDSGDSQDTDDSGTASIPTEAAVSDISARIDDDFGTLVIVSWQQEQAAEVWVEYSFDADTWMSSPAQSVEVGAQGALLLGVPYDTAVSFRVVNDFGTGALQTGAESITTDPLPDGLPIPEVLIADPTQWDAESDWLLMSITEYSGFAAIYSDWWVFIMDREGRVVWARETPSDSTSLHPRISQDGTDILIEHATFWGGGFDFGTNSRVYRMKIDGVITQTYTTPGLHHPFTDTADGSLVWAANNGTNETLQMLTPEGEQIELWDCQAHLHSIGTTGDCGSNSIHWDEGSDTFLYSFYSLFTMFEITPDGEVVRTFGQLDSAWSFDPADARFWWQHGGYYTDEGTLIVSTYVEEEGIDTVVREYELDESSQTLTEIWNFGIGDGVWGQYMGEPHRMAGGNTLHNTGSLARLREATPDGEVVWDVIWDEGSGSNWIGRSTPITDLYSLAP